MNPLPTLPECSPHVRPLSKAVRAFKSIGASRDQASSPLRQVPCRASEVRSNICFIVPNAALRFSAFSHNLGFWPQDQWRPTSTEAGVADRVKQGAVAAAISLAVAICPLPATANNVRVEDVDNPSMQAGRSPQNSFCIFLLAKK